MEPNITCHLEHWYHRRLNPLHVDSCPGQYPDRVYTINNQSFLTFVVKSDNGNYEQTFLGA